MMNNVPNNYNLMKLLHYFSFHARRYIGKYKAFFELVWKT